MAGELFLFPVAGWCDFESDLSQPIKAAPVARATPVPKDFTSCAEAKFYLNECGLSRLDGDNDGVPCESLCW